jgi:hypothetical protein
MTISAPERTFDMAGGEARSTYAHRAGSVRAGGIDRDFTFSHAPLLVGIERCRYAREHLDRARRSYSSASALKRATTRCVLLASRYSSRLRSRATPLDCRRD